MATEKKKDKPKRLTMKGLKSEIAGVDNSLKSLYGTVDKELEAIKGNIIPSINARIGRLEKFVDEGLGPEYEDLKTAVMELGKDFEDLQEGISKLESLVNAHGGELSTFDERFKKIESAVTGLYDFFDVTKFAEKVRAEINKVDSPGVDKKVSRQDILEPLAAARKVVSGREDLVKHLDFMYDDKGWYVVLKARLPKTDWLFLNSAFRNLGFDWSAGNRSWVRAYPK